MPSHMDQDNILQRECVFYLKHPFWFDLDQVYMPSHLIAHGEPHHHHHSHSHHLRRHLSHHQSLLSSVQPIN